MRDQGRAQIPRRDRPSRALPRSSPAPARSTAARWRPWPPPATRNISTGSGRRRRASTMSPMAISTSCAPRSGPRPPASWSSRCRAKAGSPPRADYLEGLRAIADEFGICWSSTKSRPAWAAPASCSPMNGPGSRPTSWGWPRDWAAVFRSARALPPSAPPWHGRRHAWLDLRRQPARHGGGQRGARRDAGAGVPRRMSSGSPASLRRRLEAIVKDPPRSSPRCAARGCWSGLRCTVAATARWSSGCGTSGLLIVGGRRQRGAAAAAAHRRGKPRRRGLRHHRHGWRGNGRDDADKTPPRHFLDLDRIDAATLRRMLDRGHEFKRGADRIAAARRQDPGDDLREALDADPAFVRGGDQAARRRCRRAHAGDSQLSRGETIADTARVLSRYVDAHHDPHRQRREARGAGRSTRPCR